MSASSLKSVPPGSASIPARSSVVIDRRPRRRGGSGTVLLLDASARTFIPHSGIFLFSAHGLWEAEEVGLPRGRAEEPMTKPARRSGLGRSRSPSFARSRAGRGPGDLDAVASGPGRVLANGRARADSGRRPAGAGRETPAGGTGVPARIGPGPPGHCQEVFRASFLRPSPPIPPRPPGGRLTMPVGRRPAAPRDEESHR